MPDPVEREETGGRVGDPLASEKRDEPREDANADPARERGPVGAAGVDEAGADHQVGLAALERREQLAELGGVVLPVAVEPDRGVVALVRART